MNPGTTTALPRNRRLARNIREGYEVLIGTDSDNGEEVWGLVVGTLELTAPIAIVSLTVECKGKQIRLPALSPGQKITSRRLSTPAPTT